MVVRLLLGYYNVYTCNPAMGKCIDLPAPASRFLSFSLRGLRGTLLPPHATTARVVVQVIPDAGVHAVAAPLPLPEVCP